MLEELGRLAIGNLLRARARLAMTAGGVLVGTTTVVLLIAATIGLQRSAEAGIGSSATLTEIEVWPNYGFNRGTSTTTDIPELDVDAVRNFWRISGVAVVVPTVNLQGGEMSAGDFVGYTQVIGIDPALLPYMGLSATRGQLSLQPGEVIIGAHAGDYFYDPSASDGSFQPVLVDLFTTPSRLRLYQYTGQTPAQRRIDLNVAGQLQEGTSYDYSILMPIQDVLRLNEWITGQEIDAETFRYDRIIVRATSRETTNSVSETIRELGFSVGGLGEYLNQLNNFFTTMRLMLGGVGGVALLVAAFGVANTMTMAILERTKEIGLMKAIGATDRDVLTVFLIEAGLVGLTGGLTGIGLSMFLQSVINQAILNAPPNENGGYFLGFDPAQAGGQLIIIPPELSVFAISLAVMVGLGAGLYPALRAARLPPVIALKSD